LPGIIYGKRESGNEERRIMIDSIEKITLYVKNQKEARDFWTERMGFIVRLEQQMGADQKWLEVGPEIS
jgi:lactoylglutathione lyase